LAHSYFGDLIVCRDFAHAWLKESWATYMEMCWFEDHHGEDERQYEFFDQLSMYLNEADNRYMRPVVTRTFNSSWNMYDGHLYPGGSCRLHTLRCALGDEVFWGAVQDYVRDFAFKTVETDDLRRAFERRSGRSLVKFFDQWLYSPGYPALKASFAFDADLRVGTLTVQQTQANPTLDIPLFDLNLHVVWVIGDQTCERTVSLSDATHTFTLPMTEAPSQVLIDPYGRTLHKLDFNPGTDRLIAQLTAGPTVLSRVFAAHALAKEGATVCALALADALAAEPFWGVRVEIARALSRLGTGLAFTSLGRALLDERDPRALTPLIQSVSRWRDPIIAAALTERLSRDDLPPRALAALYEALGTQRATAPLQTLLAAAHRAQPLGFSQAGAVRALAFTRQADVALPALLSLSHPGAATDRVRRAVADALGELSQHVPPPQRATIVERLCDLLRDPAIRVRRAAHLALRAAADTSAIPALTSFRAPLSHQEQVEIDRTIASINAAQQPAPAASERALEDLREANRRLEERLRVLEAKLLPDN
jgi:aminopeptidase N